MSQDLDEQRVCAAQDLAKCDFQPMYDYLMAEREKKKALPKEVRHRPSQKYTKSHWLPMPAYLSC